MGAFEQPGLFISQTAGRDFVLEDRYKVVSATSAGVTTAGPGPAVGVLYSMSPQGTAVKVMNKGIAITRVGAAALVAGDEVANDAGVVKKATSSDTVIGIAQENAAANSLAAILLTI